MLIPATYRSKFLKADTRPNESATDRTVYMSALDEHIVVRDVFLAGGAGIDLDLQTRCQNILLPVVGAVTVADSNERSKQLAPGTVHRSAEGSGKLFVKNAHKEETVNFLHICIKSDGDTGHYEPRDASLDITVKNELVSGTGFAANMRVGVYDSRVKDIAPVVKGKGDLVAYIINGSFEVDGRLMEYRDALLLRDSDEADFEALSELAIILFIDCSL